MLHVDLCVIGSGAGNQIVSAVPKDWSVALIDGNERFGGTCLNAGCIPTKMLEYAVDAAEAARNASRLGVMVGEVRADWAQIRERVFGRIDEVSRAGEQRRLLDSKITLIREMARFTRPGVVQAGEQTVTADRFVLAAGARTRIPDLLSPDDPALLGLLHTSDSIMRIDELPESLVILGGGASAVEFAHIFAGLGVQVTVIHRGQRLLREADDEIKEQFTNEICDRVTVRLGQQLTGISANPRGGVIVETVDADGVGYAFEGDLALLALGRVPNSDTLNVAAAGVAVDDTGRVVVDEYQRTSVPGVWALGDICSPRRLRHVANHEARVVQHNLLHPDELVKADHRFIPQAVFAGSQVAWVGLTEQEAKAQGVPYVASRRGYDTVAFGWAMEDNAAHFVKLLATPAGKLLGAHIIGAQAAILIQPLVQALSTGLDVRTMARGQYWIHPALTEVVENALLDLPLS